MAAVAPAIVIRLPIHLSSRKKEQEALDTGWELVACVQYESKSPRRKTKATETSRAAVLQVRFLDQLHLHHLGTCQKCTFSRPTPDLLLLKPDLYFKSLLAQIQEQVVGGPCGMLSGLLFPLLLIAPFFLELEAFSCLMPLRPCVQST